ncbi:hypothetical protein BDW74DRAFT_166920 [Aspergillus multicolor]|uniref:DUF3433 domain-containing protein n=1 Tax=Aspergillus multicolor TaxID=41759 RepID=UPI003CCCA71C
MLASGNVSLRTVSSSRPQLFRTESQQSAAASDDYYSLSSRTPTSRSASGGSRTTVVRYATPNSYPVSAAPSPAVSRTLLAPPTAARRAEHSPIRPPEPRETFVTQIDSSSQSSESKKAQLGLSMDGAGGEPVRDSYAGREPTPGMDDSPYIRFAINQLTREGEEDDPRRSEESGYDSTPADRLVWDGNLGHFVRSVTPAPQQQLPPERDPQASVDPEAFVAVEPPEGNLIYPALDFVPIVLRPWALSLAIFCVLLMIAGIAFSNVWSEDHQGIWGYDGRTGGRYFVVQFLPQILGIIITIMTFVIQAAVYRIMPFAIMASERPYKKVLQGLPIVPKNFLLPDLSHFMHGEAMVGFSIFTIWLSNFIAVPLLSCLFQAKWYIIDGEGTWRWAATRAVGWTLIAVYGLLALGLLSLMLRFLRTWSGLMWDPVCIADLITVIQRSNVLPGFEYTEAATDVGEALKPRTLRLGYWQLSQGRHPEIFYGMGEAGAAIGNPSLHVPPRNRREQLSKVSFDAEKQSMTGKDGSEELYSPTVRYRWAPWFLRKPAVIAWTVMLCALFIAFVVVSFVNDGVAEGFPPHLSTRPSSTAFSSSNFLYSFIPALIGTFLFLAWQHIDVYFRALQPYVMLSSPEGATAEQSLLLAYPSLLPFEVTIAALANKHYKVAWVSFMSVVSATISILAGGDFIALTYEENTIKITPLMSAFYAIVVFCAVYMASFLAIWPGRRRYLPHDISTLADQISFLYQSPMLSDKLLREPRSKTDLVTRLVITPPGDKDYPKYGFGIYVPGGLYLPMEDTVTALFFNSYIYTPRDPLIRPGSMEFLPQLYAAAPFDSHLRMSALAVAYFGVAAWTRQENLLHSAQQCFGTALARTRLALQGDVERDYDDILMTLMLLYIFEEFVSIKENKPSPKNHLRGAIALIENCSHERRRSYLSDTLTNAIQGEIVHSATDKRSPLFRTPASWPLSPGIPELASSRLMMIAPPLVKLRERWVEFSSRADTTDTEELNSILSEARNLDDQFTAWTFSLPKHWYPMPASYFPQSVRDAGAYQDRCDCYTDVWIAETWNNYRTFRLSIQNIIYRCLCLLPNHEVEIEATVETTRVLAADICASVPFYLGSQTGSMTITDSRVEYPSAEATPSPHKGAQLVGGWFIRPALDALCSVENLPDDLVDKDTVHTTKMVLSWFRTSETPQPSTADTTPSIPTQSIPETTSAPTPTPAEPTSTNTTKDTTEDLPKLWKPDTNKKLFFGGALFFAFSLLTTRRAMVRRFNASIPPYYTSSIYHKPEVNGGMEAFEALNLATLNVLSFGMMSSGGVLWAMGINSLDDMRRYVKTRMAGGEGALNATDEEMEKEVEAWVMKYLGKRIEGGKLKGLDEPVVEEGKSTYFPPRS